MTPALFLDRDGAIHENLDTYVKYQERLRLGDAVSAPPGLQVVLCSLQAFRYFSGEVLEACYWFRGQRSCWYFFPIDRVKMCGYTGND